MLLKSLRLENIRSYTNEYIEFSEGSSLLLGDIGSGKTTVLLALEFALFGFIKGDVSGTTLLRHGKNDGNVELRFEINNQDITIVRRLKRKKDTISQDSGHIITNNKKFEGTPVELKSKIIELFGYPQELLNKNTSLIFRYTVYTPQEEMKNILFETKEERLDILRRIFNIDKYKRIRENALFYGKELRTMKRILEGKTQDIEELKNKLSKTTNDLTIKKTEISTIKESLKIIQEDKKAADIEVKNLEATITKVLMLKKDLANADITLKNKQYDTARNNKDLNMVEYRIKEYTTRLEELGVIDEDEVKIKQELSDAEDKLTKINAAKEVISERLENKQKELKDTIIEDSASLKYKHDILIGHLSKRSEVQELYDLTLKNIEDIKIQINTINININHSHKVMNQIKDLSTCPTCLQVVDFTHKIKITDRENASVISDERKEKELAEKEISLTAELKKLRHDIEVLHKEDLELQQINNKLENIDKLIVKKQQLIRDIDELMIKKQKLDSMDINKLIEIISKNRKIVGNIAIRKHVQESLKEKLQQKTDILQKIFEDEKIITELREKCLVIQLEVSKNSDSEELYNRKKILAEDAAKALKEVEIKFNLAQRDEELLHKEIIRLNEELILKNKIMDKIRYISELNHWMTEHFINLTSTIEKNIMYKIHKEFNEIFQKWFTIIMEDENLEVAIDENFAPIIRQNNYDTYIENLSGGEKTAVALAYRLALNKVINDFISTINTKDILILDEPTDGFSGEQLDRMRDVLEELRMKQLIIVSHEAKMETYASNILHLTKHEHNSKIQQN